MKTTVPLSIAITIAVLAGTSAAKPLVTDRPDATESSSTVEPGYAQFELGWHHSEDNEAGDVKKDSFPSTLIRYGLVDNLELRFIWQGYNWQKTTTGGTSTHEDGNGDLATGLKVRFWDEAGWRPETALLTHLSIPVGKETFSTNRTDPDLRLAFSHTLNDTFSLAYNLGTAWVTSDSSSGELTTRNNLIYTTALGMSITEALGAYVEIFGDIPTHNQSPGPANTFDGGFTYLFADNIQLDAYGGLGLSKAADDWFVGIGLSIRTPN